MKNSQLTAMMPKATRDLYQVVDIPKGSKRMNFGTFGTIDFSKLTAKTAERLISRGFTKLVPAPAPKKKLKKEEEKVD